MPKQNSDGKYIPQDYFILRGEADRKYFLIQMLVEAHGLLTDIAKGIKELNASLNGKTSPIVASSVHSPTNGSGSSSTQAPTPVQAGNGPRKSP